jgi:sulfate transport system ATP-binding protein
VLLLDEPFGALDAKVRKDLRHWLRKLHEKIEVTSVFVTHDQEEALEIADRIVVMRSGIIEQIGTPQAVYERPETAFVHEFIGDSVAIPVTIEGGIIEFEGRPTRLSAPNTAQGHARLLARPHEMTLVKAEQAAFAGTVRRAYGFGPVVRLDVALGNGSEIVEVNAPAGAAIAEGQAVHLRPERYRVFAA